MAIASNTVVLYKDANFSGTQYVIDVYRYTPKMVQSISGTSMQDQATSLRYNLQRGCVVTLFQNNVASLNFPSLKGAGKVLDLIGDGAEHEVRLSDYGMNDCVSAFWWRQVDLSQGYMELYDDADCRGQHTTIFIAEFPVNSEPYNVDGWQVDDKLSSVRWMGMADTIVVILYDHADGTGSSFSNINNGDGECLKLSAYSFNDKTSSFKVTRLKAVKEEIKQVVIHNVEPYNTSQTQLKSDGKVNGENTTAKVDCTYTATVTETTSVTVTESHTIGAALQYTYQWRRTPGSDQGWDLTLGMTYDYTKEQSNTNSTSKTIGLSFSQEYEVPPKSTWHFLWIASIGSVDEKFTATAIRWYDMPLKGTVLDGGLFMREETLTGMFTGVMYLDNYSDFSTKPIESAE
ncbi:hypothetical protein [Nannocystis bainbridge]|uniref:Uncharacterized protein n=1 Tax=Nannocystis bainbridge TaxID=2995303 RepID=A0ABT5E995_9BACT|nr:hypothetical protein [Nannocystis bainbridge]MDC0721427.1 hypothetical protein [Nannocystis bainbridge]